MWKISKAFDCILVQIKNFNFLCEHREKQTYFSKNTAKLNFVQLIQYILSLPKASAQLEINRFLKDIRSKATMTKQALHQARMKLSYTAFTAINLTLAQNAYIDGDYRTVCGFRPIAADGSILCLPPGADKGFGLTRTTKNTFAVQARALALVDVCNDFIMCSDLVEPSIDERTLAADLVKQLVDDGITKPNDLFLHDRGFASYELFRHYEGLGVKYLFRIQDNFMKAVNEANKPDQVVVLQGKDNSSITVRVLNGFLPNGQNEKLLTNVLDDSVTPDDFLKLYNLRWGIEIKYLELKQRLDIENFSGEHENLIWQDFFATVFISNMFALAKHEAQATVDKDNAEKDRKYDYKININLAIPTIRTVLIKAFAVHSSLRRQLLFRKAVMMISKSVVPIRPGRSFPRIRKHPSAKFPLNAKSNR